MGKLEDIKAQVEKLTPEQELELRAWLEARVLVEPSQSASSLTSEQIDIVKKRLAAPREYVPDNEVRA